MARKNGKVKKSNVNYTSSGKGKSKINNRVDTKVVSTGRRIGKNITKPKYDRIRKKQALANKMIKESHEWLNTDHNAYKELKEKKANFYHKRGMRSKSKLSMKDLRYGDLTAYENMLDSIIDNPYFDRDKYEEMNAKNIKNIREGLLHDENASLEKVKEITDVLNSQVAQDLFNMGIKYDVIDAYREFSDDDIPIELFFGMLYDFTKSTKEEYHTIDEFLIYADEWKNNYNEFLEMVRMGKFNADEWQLYKSEYMKVYSTDTVMLDTLR